MTSGPQTRRSESPPEAREATPRRNMKPFLFNSASKIPKTPSRLESKDRGGREHCPLHGDGAVTQAEREQGELTLEDVIALERQRQNRCPVCTRTGWA